MAVAELHSHARCRNEQLHSLWVGEDRPRAGVSVELQPNGLDLGLKMLLRLRSWLSSTQVGLSVPTAGREPRAFGG